MGFKVDFGWLSCPRFREDDVVGGLWIPAFAGMTGGGGSEKGFAARDSGLASGR